MLKMNKRHCLHAISPLIGALLAACSIVPGQHMMTPPALPETTGETDNVTSEQTIPIVPIDLALIDRLREARLNDITTAHAADLFIQPGPYRIGVADVLQITVWDHPELAAALGQPTQTTKASDPASGFVVDGKGNIQFPYIDEPIHVAGKTADEVRQAVRDQLGKIFSDPQVTARIVSFRASQVYVDGEVRAPGAQTINDIPMSLTEAINRAGGFTGDADRSHLTLLRSGVSYPLDLTRMIALGKNPQDVMLAPGDTLRVDARNDNTAYVMGEVNKPTAAIPSSDGHLTLSDALNQAGFINQTSSNAQQLYVIRQVRGEMPAVYHLDARSPVSMLLANQFDLNPKDVVYVDNGSLVRFNRVLNLLLPAINAGVTAAVVAK
jgi:polysaccharide export outer membrane protein